MNFVPHIQQGEGKINPRDSTLQIPRRVNDTWEKMGPHFKGVFGLKHAFFTASLQAQLKRLKEILP